jgi:hypothetical protein
MSVENNKKSGSEKGPKITGIFVNKSNFQSVDYWEYCDNCGQKLIIRKCGFVC